MRREREHLEELQLVVEVVLEPEHNLPSFRERGEEAAVTALELVEDVRGLVPAGLGCRVLVVEVDPHLVRVARVVDVVELEVGVVEVDLLLRVLGNLECFEDDRISHQDTVAWVVEDA